MPSDLRQRHEIRERVLRRPRATPGQPAKASIWEWVRDRRGLIPGRQSVDRSSVIPAKAGIQANAAEFGAARLDSRLRGSDESGQWTDSLVLTEREFAPELAVRAETATVNLLCHRRGGDGAGSA